jgi:hypothetical protein
MSETATPEQRAKAWRDARDRARKHGIRVFQVEGSGQWIATSSKPGVAYALTVVRNVAYGCECAGADYGNDVCMHKAAFYDHIGAFPDPLQAMEDEDIAREAASNTEAKDCVWCRGRGSDYNPAAQERRPCWWCEGTGKATIRIGWPQF